MRSRGDTEGLLELAHPFLKILVYILIGVAITVALLLLAFFQILDFALFNSQGSPFGMVCGLFSLMGLIAIIWIVITLLMWFTILSGTTGQTHRERKRRREL
jgi:uncharacterized membrane protein